MSPRLGHHHGYNVNRVYSGPIGMHPYTPIDPFVEVPRNLHHFRHSTEWTSSKKLTFFQFYYRLLSSLVLVASEDSTESRTNRSFL